MHIIYPACGILFGFPCWVWLGDDGRQWRTFLPLCTVEGEEAEEQ